MSEVGRQKRQARRRNIHACILPDQLQHPVHNPGVGSAGPTLTDLRRPGPSRNAQTDADGSSADLVPRTIRSGRRSGVVDEASALTAWRARLLSQAVGRAVWLRFQGRCDRRLGSCGRRRPNFADPVRRGAAVGSGLDLPAAARPHARARPPVPERGPVPAPQPPLARGPAAPRPRPEAPSSTRPCGPQALPGCPATGPARGAGSPGGTAEPRELHAGRHPPSHSP